MAHRDDPAGGRQGKDSDELHGDATRNEASRDGRHDQRDQDLIGQNLRRVYDEVAAEPLPDRFKDLLDQLKKGGR